MALVAAGVVRLVGYRWVLLGELTAPRQGPLAAAPPPGDAAPQRGRAGLRRGRPHRRDRPPAWRRPGRRGRGRRRRDRGGRRRLDDATADAALAAGADQVVVQPQNRGKGAAVRAGVLAARGRTVAFTDADLAYAPDQVLRVLAAVEDGWDVAIGDRRHPDPHAGARPSRLRAWGSRVINLARLRGAAGQLPRHPVRAQGVPLRRGPVRVRPAPGRRVRLRHRGAAPRRAPPAVAGRGPGRGGQLLALDGAGARDAGAGRRPVPHPPLVGRGRLRGARRPPADACRRRRRGPVHPDGGRSGARH